MLSLTGLPPMLRLRREVRPLQGGPRPGLRLARGDRPRQRRDLALLLREAPDAHVPRRPGGHRRPPCPSGPARPSSPARSWCRCSRSSSGGRPSRPSCGAWCRRSDSPHDRRTPHRRRPGDRAAPVGRPPPSAPRRPAHALLLLGRRLRLRVRSARGAPRTPPSSPPSPRSARRTAATPTCWRA